MQDEPDRDLLRRFTQGDRQSRSFGAWMRRIATHTAIDQLNAAVPRSADPPRSQEALMKTHPLLRAYMAGVTVPTFVLILILTVYAYNRFYFEVSSQFVIPLPGEPLDRAIVFPMAVVPNMWGAWNMLYLAVRSRVRWSIGLHGALLVLVLMPLGFSLASALDVFTVQWKFALPMAPVGMTVYYLAWKYLVGFLNQEVGIA